jgi:hypothetical protein
METPGIFPAFVFALKIFYPTVTGCAASTGASRRKRADSSGGVGLM